MRGNIGRWLLPAVGDSAAGEEIRVVAGVEIVDTEDHLSV